MFKKSISCAFAVVALVAGSQAFAGNFSGPGATTVSPASGAAQPCAALSNDVSVQLSNGVFAGYTCTTTNFIAATCHGTGTNKSQTIPCTYTETFDDQGASTGFSKSDTQCPDRAADGSGGATSATFDGRVAFRGASGGGTVGAVNLRGNTCNGAAAEGLTNTP